MPNEPSWLTVDEYAEMMRLHPTSVARQCREGNLPAERVGGKWRIYYEPPGYDRRIEQAAEEVADVSFKACAEMLDSIIEGLQQIKAELNQIREKTCS